MCGDENFSVHINNGYDYSIIRANHISDGVCISNKTHPEYFEYSNVLKYDKDKEAKCNELSKEEGCHTLTVNHSNTSTSVCISH